MNVDYVILVDEQDREIGSMEKLQAHLEAKLHRAISVFIFNSNNELLLQKRSATKYHSGGLWTNTCCSHPRPNENTADAAKRRLQEEMGMNCDLQYVFNFTYLAKLENGITEHEFDYVFFGFTNDEPKLNLEEASDYTYLPIHAIEDQLKESPEQFSAWFKLIFDRVKIEISKKK